MKPFECLQYRKNEVMMFTLIYHPGDRTVSLYCYQQSNPDTAEATGGIDNTGRIQEGTDVAREIGHDPNNLWTTGWSASLQILRWEISHQNIQPMRNIYLGIDALWASLSWSTNHWDGSESISTFEFRMIRLWIARIDRCIGDSQTVLFTRLWI